MFRISSKTIIRIIIGIVVLAFIVTSFLSCSRSSTKKLKIQKANSKENLVLKVEIADDDQERMRGLMFRKEMGEKEGMLFIFDHDSAVPFWMKNTYLALDIIFISSQKEIVDIIQNAQPLSEELIRPNAPYRWALEVNGGFAKKYNIETGDRVMF